MAFLTRSSLRFYLATNTMVVIGVAVAVAVLAGALLVGASVKASLREIAIGRLGATDVIVVAPSFFRAALADDLMRRVAQPRQSPLGARVDAYRALNSAAPLIALNGAVVHESSKQSAAHVAVYGIDERFARFQSSQAFGVQAREALITPALAKELGARAGDTITVDVAKPSDIPLATLQGRRESTGERLRATVARVLDGTPLSEFSLAPAQGAVLAVYLPMGRVQRDLDLGDRANTLLLKLADGISLKPADTVRELVAPVATLDDLALRIRATPQHDTIVETRAGLMPPALVDEINDQAAKEQRRFVAAMTYVANSIRIGDRAVPYSTVTAIDLDGYNRMAGAVGPTEQPVTAGLSATPDLSHATHPPIWLNQWAATDLDARIGDEVTLDYFLWSDQQGLRTSSAVFTLVGVQPMTGVGGDQTLTPEYPGISDAPDITSWDPPFPVDLKRVRKKDEDYWDQYRAAPKAIIGLAEGQRLWGSPFGSVSSIRVASGGARFIPSVDPIAAGFVARNVREDAIAAAEGTTDFGEYFLYFSFFLVVSALLLSYLFFALGLEQRTREVGLLSSIGFAPSAIRASFAKEGAVLCAIGASLGLFAAVGYGAFIMYGLRTWWVGAVGTTALTLHVAPDALAAGAIGASIAGLLALALGIRAMIRRSTRALLLGSHDQPSARRSQSRRSMVMAAVVLVTGAGLMAGGFSGAIDPTASFFGAGSAVLAAGLFAAAAFLRRQRGAGTSGSMALLRLGFAQASNHPHRSVLSLSLIALACFVLISVGAFRKDVSGASLDRASGVGGYSLIAESVAPLMHDPNSAAGRAEFGFETDDPLLTETKITRLRLRPGDEASCLSLYKPSNPRIIAPEAAFIAEKRFAFSASMAATDAERDNPWTLLSRTFEDGAVPAIADQTTLVYVLHRGVGDDFVLDPEGPSPTTLRIVGALSDSVLQSELIIGETNFVKLFPHNEGYRMWLIETPAAQAAAVGAHLEDRLSDFGFDATTTTARWASYHQVENTYLATFQALGALGLLLGTIGVGAVLARNVLERRRELALLRAVGFSPSNVRTVVMAESLALVAGGVLLGTTAAVIAMLPALRDRSQSLPIAELAALGGAVMLTGVIASLVAVRTASAVNVVQALKSE